MDHGNDSYTGGSGSKSGYQDNIREPVGNLESPVGDWANAVSSGTGIVCGGEPNGGIVGDGISEFQVEFRPLEVEFGWNRCLDRGAGYQRD